MRLRKKTREKPLQIEVNRQAENRPVSVLDVNGKGEYSLVAVEVNSKKNLKFIVSDGIDQHKMYVESIQRDYLVTKCTHHHKTKCLARHIIKTRIEVVKAGYKARVDTI